MFKVITITSMVGGTGKTSLLANLATVLTKDFGKLVLCIGMAPDLEEWFLTPPSTNYSLRALGLPTRPPTDSEVQAQKPAPNYLILGQSESKASLAWEKFPVPEKHYDYVLIEAKWGVGWARELAFQDADLVLIAGGLNRFETLGQQRRLADNISQLLTTFRPEPVPIRTVLTVPVPRTTGEEEYLTPEQLKRLDMQYTDTYWLPDLPPLCAAQIRADEAYEESVFMCQPVAHYRPKSRTLKDYRLLAHELMTIVHGH